MYRTRDRLINFSEAQLREIFHLIIEDYHHHYPLLSKITRINIVGGKVTCLFEHAATKESLEELEVTIAKITNAIRFDEGNIMTNGDLFTIMPPFSDDDSEEEESVKTEICYTVQSTIPFHQVKTRAHHAINRSSLQYEGSNLRKIEEYFRNKETQHKVKTVELNPKSVALINEYHTNKHPECKNIYICENMQDFINFLNSLQKNDLPDTIDLGIEIILPKGHMQAIKLERANRENYFTVIDSVGSEEYNQLTIQMINLHCPAAHIKYSITRRQCDQFSCRLFAAKDAKKMMLTPDLFSKMLPAEQKSEQTESKSDSHIENATSSAIPPNFMDLAQSNTDIRQYIANLEGKTEGKSLSDKIDKEKEVKGRRISPYYEIKHGTIVENKNYRSYYFAEKYYHYVHDKIRAADNRELKDIFERRNLSKIELVLNTESIDEKSKIEKEKEVLFSSSTSSQPSTSQKIENLIDYMSGLSSFHSRESVRISFFDSQEEKSSEKKTSEKFDDLIKRVGNLPAFRG